MTTEEKELFARALARTRRAGVMVTVLCVGMGGLMLASTLDPTSTSRQNIAMYLLGGFFVAVGALIAYANVIKAPGRVRRVMAALESSPSDIVALTISVHATAGTRQITLTEAEALAYPPAGNAQWRVEIALSNEKVSVMLGRDDALELAALVRGRVPALAAARAA